MASEPQRSVYLCLLYPRPVHDCWGLGGKPFLLPTTPSQTPFCSFLSVSNLGQEPAWEEGCETLSNKCVFSIMNCFCCIERLGSQAKVYMTQKRKRQAIYKLVLNFSSTALLRPQEEVATLGEHLANWLSSETVKRLGACCSQGLKCYPYTALFPIQKAT